MSVTGASGRVHPGNGGGTGKTVSAAGFWRERAMAEHAITALLTGKNVCKRRACLFITMSDNVQLSDVGSQPPGIASQ
jgi:hypothetical protein